MARRKDHTPEQLKQLILSSAERLVALWGREGLTARAVATDIYYSPGTIYNFYQDMDALVVDVNYATLGRLQAYCQHRIADLPPGFSKVSALAYAYADFAEQHRRAWESVFASNAAEKQDSASVLPGYYQQRLADIFLMIETVLMESLNMPEPAACSSARLLWACLHGITVLTLSGTLDLVGVAQPHALIDDLLEHYLVQYR